MADAVGPGHDLRRQILTIVAATEVVRTEQLDEHVGIRAVELAPVVVQFRIGDRIADRDATAAALIDHRRQAGIARLRRVAIAVLTIGSRQREPVSERAGVPTDEVDAAGAEHRRRVVIAGVVGRRIITAAARNRPKNVTLRQVTRIEESTLQPLAVERRKVDLERVIRAVLTINEILAAQDGRARRRRAGRECRHRRRLGHATRIIQRVEE